MVMLNKKAMGNHKTSSIKDNGYLTIKCIVIKIFIIFKGKSLKIASNYTRISMSTSYLKETTLKFYNL